MILNYCKNDQNLNIHVGNEVCLTQLHRKNHDIQYINVYIQNPLELNSFDLKLSCEVLCYSKLLLNTPLGMKYGSYFSLIIDGGWLLKIAKSILVNLHVLNFKYDILC